MPELTFAYDGHLGGCVLPSPTAPHGDPATWCPHLWRWLVEALGVRSVLDVGSGAGFASRFFDRLGCRVTGIEGCREAIDKQVCKNVVVAHDFRDGPADVGGEFDLGWCCEVVEHVDREFEDHLLRTLGQCRFVAMTHGEPGQGGHHHVNLQHASYWVARMAALGYRLNVRLTQQARVVSRFEAVSNHFVRSGLVFERTAEATPARDVLLTWASGKEHNASPELGVFLNTSRRFAGDKVAFTHDMDLEARERFEAAGFRVEDVDPNEVTWVVRDRFRHYASFLGTHPRYRLCFLVDSRDVLFLGDPVAWVDDFAAAGGLAEYLVLCGEGHTHGQSVWNRRDQERLQGRMHRRPYESWPVLNGGFQAGTAAAVVEFCREIHSLSDPGTHPERATDQAAINYFHRVLGYRFGATLVALDPAEHDLVLHGEPIHTGVAPAPDYRRFRVFHQWDRTHFRDEIIRDHGGDVE